MRTDEGCDQGDERQRLGEPDAPAGPRRSPLLGAPRMVLLDELRRLNHRLGAAIGGAEDSGQTEIFDQVLLHVFASPAGEGKAAS